MSLRGMMSPLAREMPRHLKGMSVILVPQITTTLCICFVHVEYFMFKYLNVRLKKKVEATLRSQHSELRDGRDGEDNGLGLRRQRERTERYPTGTDVCLYI